MIVPKVAMLMVSHRGTQSLFMYDHAGGTMREPISAATRGESQTKIHVVDAEINCQQ